MNNNLKYFANSLLWSSVAKILNAVLKFISIPLLLGYFGKENYGILTLVVAVNAYMQLLDMGMNTGVVKYLSQWIAIRDFERVNRVVRTNLTVYIFLGVINSLLLVLLAEFGESIFSITAEEFQILRYLLYVLAFACVANWTIFVFCQLLIADEQIAYTQQVLSIRNVFNLVVVLIAIKWKFSLIEYFLCDSIINVLVLIPYIWACRKGKLIQCFSPGFYWTDFAEVMKYSFAIFTMSLFQYTATQSRPLILSIFSDEGSSVLSDYRVVEVFPVFIISLGGMLISIFLPKTSNAIQQKNKEAIRELAYEGTKYTSILISLLCFPVFFNSADILSLYVGESYRHLAIWLQVWILTLTLFLHNTPVATLILATGKTRMLVYSSAIACLISVAINVILCAHLSIGSAVIGYLFYVIIQILFYYLYFNNKVLKLDSLRIFKSFIKPTTLGLLTSVPIVFISFSTRNLFVDIALKSIFWITTYFVSLVIFGVVDVRKITRLLKEWR